MAVPDLRAPLTDSELDQLDGFLTRVAGGSVPNVEALDGFLTALAVCPEIVPPSEIMQVIQTGAIENDDLVFDGIEEAEFFFSLVMRHWNTIVRTLGAGEPYMPVLAAEADGQPCGNDWAAGFLHGTRLRKHAWRPLMEDEERGDPFMPLFALAHEHHPDPEMRPSRQPLDGDRRENLIVSMVAGVKHLYDMFREAAAPPSGLGRTGRKQGRNEPCPCGSGREFRKCCGGVTIH